MATSASLPLPAAARVAAPTSRSVAQAWAAPRAADLVLDPWAAPVGPPIAVTLLSPWPAPQASMRIISMPPPAALAELPDIAVQTRELSDSTAAAITALNSDAARSAVIGAGATPAAPAAPLAPPVAAEAPVFAPEPTTESTRSIARLRVRLWALVAGGAAATAGVVALLTAAF